MRRFTLNTTNAHRFVCLSLKRKLFFIIGAMGFFKEKGIIKSSEGYPKYYPMARVRYDSIDASILMPIGNAVEYSRVFGGDFILDEDFQELKRKYYSKAKVYE